MTDRLRNRAQNKFRHKWQVIEREPIRDLLLESGYDSLTFVGGDMADDVARALQAHAYVYGELRKQDATPIVTLRMVDMSRTGLSGWVTVTGQPGDPARTFADRVVDSLENQVRAADFAKECIRRRDRAEFRRARQAADRAYQLYPHHPSTSQCLSYVFEGTQAPPDSVIWALQNWTMGDSLHMRAQENLVRLLMQNRDTTRALTVLKQQLEMNPADTSLRHTIAAGLSATGDPDGALELVDEGLSQHPGNIRFLLLKGRVCLDHERFECTLDAWTQRYDLDTSVVGDTAFYPPMLMLAQQVQDTMAMLRWASLGLEYEPNKMSYLRVRGALLRALEHSDSALSVYEAIAVQEPQNLDALAFVANGHNEAFIATIDSTTPLDTGALAAIEAELTNLLTFQDRMPNIVAVVGGAYLQIAQALHATQNQWPLTIEYSEKAIANDPNGAFTPTANYFLGIAIFSDVYPRMDEHILEAQACSPLIDEYERALLRARDALMIGRSVSEEGANIYLEYLQQLLPRPQQFRDAWCRES